MTTYTWGFIAGFAAVLILALIVFLLVRKKTGGTKYDERQMLGRGKAFQTGFFTLLILEALVTILIYLDILPGEPFLWHIGALFLSVGVFALTAIHFDAYVGMTDTPKRFITMGVFLALAMVCSGSANMLSEQATNHTIGWMNLMLAALWVIIIISLLLHNRRKAEDDE